MAARIRRAGKLRTYGTAAGRCIFRARTRTGHAHGFRDPARRSPSADVRELAARCSSHTRSREVTHRSRTGRAPRTRRLLLEAEELHVRPVAELGTDPRRPGAGSVA